MPTALGAMLRHTRREDSASSPTWVGAHVGDGGDGVLPDVAEGHIAVQRDASLLAVRRTFTWT